MSDIPTEVTVDCIVRFEIESTTSDGAWVLVKLISPDGDVLREWDSRFLNTGNGLFIENVQFKAAFTYVGGKTPPAP